MGKLSFKPLQGQFENGYIAYTYRTGPDLLNTEDIFICFFVGANNGFPIQLSVEPRLKHTG